MAPRAMITGRQRPSGASMRYVLCTMGSAGDVFPMIGLGAGLKARGHAVWLMTNPYSQRRIEAEGLAFLPLGTVADFEAAMDDPRLWDARRGFEYVVESGMLPGLPATYDALEAFDPLDTVLVASGLMFGARVAQEARGFRLATVHLQPSMLRSVYETACYPGLPVGPRTPRWLKRLAFAGIDRLLIDRLIAPELNAFRRRLGLAEPVVSVFGRWMHSPDLVVAPFPGWFAAPQPDWPAATRLTGFARYDAGDGAGLDAGLDAFLGEGAAPLAFTAGSAMRQGRDFFRAAVDACERLGQRGLLLSGHSEQLPALPATVYAVRYAPFSAVFPRCAAVVHHGGIGTAAQALAAGVPQLVTPMAHDQPDNAARLARLGVAASLPFAKVSGVAFATTLASLLARPGLAERCAELAGRVDFAAGRERALDAIEALRVP
ncbi:glycosyltransferase [Crenobacter cavernae]|uniref:Glycosyltransferase n=2 Tax=Crenobacter cavernae TaxID=2290923 RepID=A0A345Y8X7_9NEIS|nr:glycosyltransferase [Crenobacter cavernae]